MAAAQITPALRAIVRRPGLTVARLVTVAMVVAATGSVTAIASAILLRQLPFPASDRLVRIYLQPSESTDYRDANDLFPVVFEHRDARGPSLESVAGIWQLERSVAGRAEPESVLGGRVSLEFFSMLGTSLAAGRTFTDAEVRSDAPLVVLSYGLWSRMFGSDPEIVGATVQIDRRSHTVIGVAAQDFNPAFTATQFWTPMNLRDSRAVRSTAVQTFGRLRSDATPASAIADLQPVIDGARAESPDLISPYRIRALDLREARYGAQRNALLMLLAVVCALGLIAAANLANLTFADLASRVSDFTLRAALGGSTSAMVMSEIVPVALIATLGAGAGLLVAATAAPWMLALDPSPTFAGIKTVVDWRVAIAGLITSIGVMAIAVALPTWLIARRDRLASFSGPRLTDARGSRIRSWLVGGQTAVALVLLSAAALVVTALQRHAATGPGFDPSNVVTGQLRLAERAYPDHPSRVRFMRAILDRLRESPGIIDAGTTLNLFTVGASFSTNLWVEDVPRPDGQSDSVQFRRVSPGYFETMRIRALRGRLFLPTDTEATPVVTVVSESFARRYWPDGDAVGRRIRRGAATQPWAEIVGVVDDVRDAGLDRETGPIMYTSYFQGSTASTPAGLVVRTAGDPRSAIQHIKQSAWAIDSGQPLSNVVLLDDYLSASLGPLRFRAWLVALCSSCGLLLATVWHLRRYVAIGIGAYA